MVNVNLKLIETCSFCLFFLQIFIVVILQGQTGFPFVDAIMRQLCKEGWISSLARQVVGSFLTQGCMWMSWEEGFKVKKDTTDYGCFVLILWPIKMLFLRLCLSMVFGLCRKNWWLYFLSAVLIIIARTQNVILLEKAWSGLNVPVAWNLSF